MIAMFHEYRICIWDKNTQCNHHFVIVAKNDVDANNRAQRLCAPYEIVVNVKALNDNVCQL